MKKVITLLVVGFLLFWLLSRPQDAADSVGAVWDGAIDGFGQILQFINRLFT